MRMSGQGKKSSKKRQAASLPETAGSHDTYRAIFDNVNDGIILRDIETKRILDVNSKLCEMTGYAAGEIKTMPPGWFNASPAQNGKTVADHYAEAARGKPQLFELQGRRKDGTPIRVESNLRKVAIGGRDCLLSVLRDVTARRKEREELRQAEDGLKESEKTLRALLDAITEPVVLMDTDRTVLALNQTLAGTIGKDPGEIVGTRIDTYFDPKVMAQRKEYTDSVVRSGKPVRFDSERAGRYFEHCAYPVFDDAGKVTRIAAYARDVTSHKEAQKELEAKTRYIEEMNAALKVLLNQRELDRNELEERVLSNVKQLILPVLQRLRNCGLDEDARTFLDLLETNVNEVVSPFMSSLDAYRFTPRELEVISLVREGRTAKETARLLNVCKGAVDIYRHRIRKKLGITTVKTNLRAYLLSLSQQ